MTDWNALIRDVIAGDWRDPDTGKAAPVPFEIARIEEDLEGGAADLVAPLNIGRRLAVVCDSGTYEAWANGLLANLKPMARLMR